MSKWKICSLPVLRSISIFFMVIALETMSSIWQQDKWRRENHANFGQHMTVYFQLWSKVTIWPVKSVLSLCQVGQGILTERSFLKTWSIGLDVKTFVFGLLWCHCLKKQRHPGFAVSFHFKVAGMIPKPSYRMLYG